MTTLATIRKLNTIGNLVYYLARNRGGVRYSIDKGAYIWNSNGRAVSDGKIQNELDKLAGKYHDNVERLADRLDSGNLTTAQWQDRMRREIKDIHRTQYIIGRGGREQMTQRDYGRLGADLRWMQYKKLDGFALDIANGKTLPDGSTRPYSRAEIRARSNLYMNAANKQYWRGKTEGKVGGGYVEEQRFTHNPKPCGPCKESADKGRQPIGTLPEPGEDCDGMTNCRCTKVYYKADGSE